MNQREYCEAMNLPPKPFSNWRRMFRKEPEPFKRKLLCRRGGLKHTLSHTLSHAPSHGACPSSPEPPALVVPLPRDGHRRRFGEAERRLIIAEAELPSASMSAVARHHGIDRRLLCRWKENLAAPIFVEIVVANGADPFAYLKDVLERMTNGQPVHRLDDLLPWNWPPSVVHEYRTCGKLTLTRGGAEGALSEQKTGRGKPCGYRSGNLLRTEFSVGATEISSSQRAPAGSQDADGTHRTRVSKPRPPR